MKSKWYFAALIIELLIAFLAIIIFIVLTAAGENVDRFVLSFLLAIALAVVGTMELVEHIKEKK